MERHLNHLHEDGPEINRIMRILGRFKSRPSAEIALERFQQVVTTILQSVQPEVEVFFERNIEKRESPISYNIQDIIASHLTPYMYNDDLPNVMKIDEDRDIGYFRVKNVIPTEDRDTIQKIIQRLSRKIINTYVDLYAYVMEERINLAFIDTLTRVPNRLWLLRATNEVFSPWEDGNIAPNIPFSVILFDLDFFKNINTRFGHGGGDIALEFTAKRLSEFTEYAGSKYSIPAEDIFIARLWWEEFVLILLWVNEVLSQEIGNELVAYISKEPVELIPEDIWINAQNQSSLNALFIEYIENQARQFVQRFYWKPAEPLLDSPEEDVEEISTARAPVSEFIKISAGVSTYNPSMPLQLNELVEFIQSQKWAKSLPPDASKEEIISAIEGVISSWSSFPPILWLYIKYADSGLQRAKDTWRNKLMAYDAPWSKISLNIQEWRWLKKHLESSLRWVDDKWDIIRVIRSVLWKNSKFNPSSHIRKWLLNEINKGKSGNNSPQK